MKIKPSLQNNEMMVYQFCTNKIGVGMGLAPTTLVFFKLIYLFGIDNLVKLSKMHDFACAV